MKTIFFRKVFPYDPTFGGKFSRYEGYSLITLQKDSPGVSEVIPLKLKIGVPILASPLKRARETAVQVAKELSINKIEYLPCLSEVRFDLGSLVSESEFLKDGSNLVRKRFVEEFIKDNLSEKREDIKKRVQELEQMVNNLPQGNYLVIGHSFYMKILESYFKHKNLFEEPEVLALGFDCSKKTYDFGKGFEVVLQK